MMLSESKCNHVGIISCHASCPLSLPKRRGMLKINSHIANKLKVSVLLAFKENVVFIRAMIEFPLSANVVQLCDTINQNQ